MEYEVDESVKAERSELVISNYKDAPEKVCIKDHNEALWGLCILYKMR